MFVRRRPLLRAAMVGGAAYAVGKNVQRGRDMDYDQSQRLDALEYQQYQQSQQMQAPPMQAPPRAGGMSDAAIEQLKQLAELNKQGILTDEEFTAQKQKLLQGG
jgi:hypothetical protein